MLSNSGLNFCWLQNKDSYFYLIDRHKNLFAKVDYSVVLQDSHSLPIQVYASSSIQVYASSSIFSRLLSYKLRYKKSFSIVATYRQNVFEGPKISYVAGSKISCLNTGKSLSYLLLFW